jgi:hypothetical protein
VSSRICIAASAALAIVVTLTAPMIACKDDKGDACTVDIDCPQGSFCRAEVCAIVSTNDAGGIDAEIPPTCGAPNPPCPGEDSGIDPGNTPGACRDVYGLCTLDTDCCPNLSCTNGTCR